MFEFHYHYNKPKYGDKTTLLITDTDSLVYAIETVDFYADTKDDLENRFQSGEYSKDHTAALAHEVGGINFKGGCNKKIAGMMKDETAGKKIN